MKPRRWLAVLAAPPLIAYLVYGPNLTVSMRKPADRDNLHRLGVALASYMVDHDGAYPLITTSDVQSYVRQGDRIVSIERHNPLAPYATSAGALFSPATHLPYELRFVRTLRYFNPRDPMAAVNVCERLRPNPLSVVAVSQGYDWPRGWFRTTYRLYDGSRMKGRQLVLRSDGHVEDVDLSSARMTVFNGKIGKWGPVGAAVNRIGDVDSWANQPWIVYPREPLPEASSRSVQSTPL